MANSTQTIRNTLLDEMKSLVEGKTSHQRARAVASLAKAAIATAQFEIQHAQFVGDTSGQPKAVNL